MSEILTKTRQALAATTSEAEARSPAAFMAIQFVSDGRVRDSKVLSDWPDWFLLPCIITDLSNKHYFVERSAVLLDEGIQVLRSRPMAWSKRSPESMDCYLHFESFLFQARSLLDLLAKFWARVLRLRTKFPSRSFRELRMWATKGVTDADAPQQLIQYLRERTAWFEMLRSWRDVVAHRQGYNPMVGMREGDDFFIGICVNYRFNFSHLDLRQVVRPVLDGIEDLMKFSDEFLAQQVLQR